MRIIWPFRAGVIVGILAFLAGCFGNDGAPDNIAQPQHILPARAFAWAPDGSVVMANERGDWNFLSLPDGKIGRTLAGAGGPTTASFSVDGQFLCAIADDKTVLVWRVSDGKLLASLQATPAHQGRLCALAIAPDGQHVAASSLLDRELFVWSVKNALLIAKRDDVPYQVLGWTKDGTLMANSSFRIENDHLKPVRPSDSAFYLLTQDRIYPSPDGEQAALVGGNVRAINLRDGSHQDWNFPNGTITNVAWAPDKKRIALRFQTGDSVRGPHIRSFVEVRRTSDGALLHFMQVGTSKSGTDTLGTDLNISRDGKWLAIGSRNGTLMWDMSGWITPIPEPPSPSGEGRARY